MFNLFIKSSEACSKLVTKVYSTSFNSAINLLHRDLRIPIFNIYGFVRFADEIVDTFHNFDKKYLLQKFKIDTYEAIAQGISLNPILNSFQKTVNEFNIDHKHIDAFFKSMEMDLEEHKYNKMGYNEYIYGSAEVVGLMCLHVFCEKNETLYKHLLPNAQALGAAFQKVNFLRDLKADFEGLNRTYFPEVDFKKFTAQDKLQIENDIKKDFEKAYIGIKQLPLKSRFGVYVAYKYYLSLLNKITQTSAQAILESRIRVPDYQKAYIVVRATVKNKFNLIK
jgi:15-cis-phytoene synthase